MAAPTTRKKTFIPLIGYPDDRLMSGSQLPSRGEALRRLFHIIRYEKQLTVKAAAECTIGEILEVWNIARIPTHERKVCVSKLISLHGDWRKLMRNQKKMTASPVARREVWKKSLDNLFDIAHQRALELLQIPEDKEFLTAQREEGRRGIMMGVDRQLAELERRQLKRASEASVRRTREQERTSEVGTVELASSSSSSSPCRKSATSDADDEPQPSTSATCPAPPKRRRGREKIISPTVAAALDRTGISDRQTVYVLSAVAETLGHDVSELTVNRESIRQSRRRHRKQAAQDIKAAFAPDVPLVVHWDGKLVPDSVTGGSRKVDRLPILVSGNGVAKLLSVPKLDTGSGEAMANAVVEALRDWGIADQVVGMCFDTTASNTGPRSGACVLIEQQLGRELLHAACRHHVLELIAAKAFGVCLNTPSSGPDIPLFRRFRDKWDCIDQDQYEVMIDDHFTDIIRDSRDDLIAGFKLHLSQHQPRDDYRELLELSIIVLGGMPDRGIRFRRPGAHHHARWMAKVVYALKIYLFRGQANLTAKENAGILRFVKFAVSVYIPAWYIATSPASAPTNDLSLLKTMAGYEDKSLAKTLVSGFARRHLWYLSESLVPLAFFDESLPPQRKRAMVEALTSNEGSEDLTKRAVIDPSADMTQKTLADFVTTSSRMFFVTLGIDDGFLETDPAKWNDDPRYVAAAEKVNGIRVMNDFAERGVALMEAYNLTLTKDEDQRQYILQVVEAHRGKFPNANKGTVTRHLQ